MRCTLTLGNAQARCRGIFAGVGGQHTLWVATDAAACQHRTGSDDVPQETSISETELESEKLIEMMQEAATFYKKFGFQETEVVKDYYKLADGRDALILSRDLTGEPELAAAQPT